MVDTTQIEEHMEVVGSDGEHVGSVDNLGIKLTKKDPLANDQHHYIKLETVATIEGAKLVLNMPAQQALADMKVVEN